MLRFRTLIVLFAAAWMCSAQPAAAALKVALVIGNAEYEFTAPLANPSADAQAVSNRLQEIGFEVELVENLRGSDARRVLGSFAGKSQAAEIALVYYAGHGIEIAGKNFLVPVDARMETEAEAQFEAIPLDDVVRAVGGARKVGLVMLDACRDNPFAAKMLRRDGTRSLSRGLAPVEVQTRGLLISFAAEAGSTADDGSDAHSPYTQALLDVLQEPGVEIGFMFRKMRGLVSAATGGRQTPIEHMLLPDEAIFLVPAVVRTEEAPPVESGPTAAEALEAAIKVDTPRGWELLLKNFGPEALSGPEADGAIAKIQHAAAGTDPAQIFESLLALDRQQRVDVQAALNAAGFDVGTPDGAWGQRTRAGIRQLQASLGLAESGYVDAALLGHLGVAWAAATSSFVNAPFAATHDPNLLRILGEEESVVDTLECLDRRRSIYGRHGDSYYFVVAATRSILLHAEKFEECGGYLAAITSQAENDFIYSMIEDEIAFFDLGFDTRTGYSYKNGPYFGLWQDPVAREPAGGWRWRNGEPLNYTNWAPGMPLDDRTGHSHAQYFADRRGQADMTNADARRWFDNDGRYARSAVMEIDF
jgi:peptidoglycan hydrolase-like protein with peptidoglycan-binding domain